MFDTNNNGIKEKVSWISGEDGILVYDKDEDGQIDGINEVFGSGEISGYQELRYTADVQLQVDTQKVANNPNCNHQQSDTTIGIRLSSFFDHKERSKEMIQENETAWRAAKYQKVLLFFSTNAKLTTFRQLHWLNEKKSRTFCRFNLGEGEKGDALYGVLEEEGSSRKAA